ncbi:hypothetical protein [Desulfitobacterium hafniense]|nr:hypothetical protein [Desulfitobacterium hafniense]
MNEYKSAYDLTRLEELQRLIDMGILQKICPALTCSTCNILDEIL